MCLVTLVAGLQPYGATAIPRLAYRFELRPGEALVVHVDAPGDPSGRTELAVSREWGGVRAGGDDLERLEARDGTGRPLAVERQAPERWVVTHSPGAHLAVTYRIPPNEHQTADDPATNRRPIFNRALFHSVGELFLVQPAQLADAERLAVELSWSGFEEAGWEAVSSFGRGDRGPLVLSAAELRQSIFLAGPLAVSEHAIQGGPLTIAALDAGWPADLDTFTALAAGIVDAERRFFAEEHVPSYLVTLIPVGQPREGASSMGGTGLTRSFSLAIQPGFDFAAAGPRESLAMLLAHETFHEWNGRLLGRRDPEELVYWFSEGFTEFFARRILHRGGWLSTERYVALLNESLAGYFTSPVRGEPNERILADFWKDRDVGRLPYRRGDLVAMILDDALRQASGGERDLDEAMRALVERGREGWVADTDGLLAVFGECAGADLAADLRAVVVGGALPVLAPDTFAPCLELSREPSVPFEPGFDVERSLAERRVSGVVPGSRAFAAGLRDGQELVGWSVHHGDVTREVVLQVREDEGVRELRFLPAGEPVVVPRFALTDPEACASL